MSRPKHIVSVILMFLMLVLAAAVFAQEKRETKEGPYLVVEGKVTQVSARRLFVDDQQYPISMFARVYSENGQEISVQMIVNVGKIDLARLYILRGKVEKIIILKNL